MFQNEGSLQIKKNNNNSYTLIRVTGIEIEIKLKEV